MCGTDGALYLIFMRFGAKFFSIVTMMNLLIVIPIYAFGDNTGQEMYNHHGELVLVRLLSLLNIKHDDSKVAIVFTFNMFFYTLMTLYLMKTYWYKSYNWRHKEHSHTIKFLDYDISMHSIMIKNIDSSVPAAEMTEIIKRIFEKLFPGG
jgi:Late exocytosis, associated with Golgi transport